MDNETYMEKVKEHLDNKESYLKVAMEAEDLEMEVQQHLKKHEDDIPEYLMKAMNPSHTTLPVFYGLPKVHKQNIPLRPVVAACDSPMTNLSIVVERILNQLLRYVPAHLKNTADALERIRQRFPELTCPPGTIVATLDVKALYPSIPIAEGMEAVRELMVQHRDDIDTFGIPGDVIMDSLEFILRHNVFKFGKDTYRQIDGIAMGNQVAPPLAIIFMGRLERQLISKSKLAPELYGRYVDDILMVWLHGSESLHKMIAEWNETHQQIKFTCEDSTRDGTVSFMDVSINITADNRFEFELYEKVSDSGICVPHDSATPEHVKVNIAAAQMIRAKRLSSTSEAEERSMEKVKGRLESNGYSKGWIEKQEGKHHGGQRKKESVADQKVRISLPYKNEWLNRRVKQVAKKSGLPVEIVYGVKKDTLQGRLTRSRLEDEECTYQRWLRENAVKRKRGRPMNECIVCKWSKGKRKNVCQQKNVVYSITCVHCNDEYIGETERKLLDRVKEHAAQAEKRKEDTPWGSHYGKIHLPSCPVEFRDICVIARASDIVNRKIRESVEIRDRKPKINISHGYPLS